MATLVVDPSLPYFYPTINAALSVALPGDTILVYPSNYNESVLVNTPDIRFQANGPGVILDGLGSLPYSFEILAPNVIINGFAIHNYNTGIRIFSDSNKLIHNTITGSTSYGVEIYGNINKVHQNVIDSYSSDVIYIDGGIKNNIRNNTITVLAPNHCGFHLCNFTSNNSITTNTINITPGSMGFNIDQSTNDSIRKNTLI